MNSQQNRMQEREPTSLFLKGEWAERLAIMSKVWVLSPEYTEQLEKYFLLRSDNEILVDCIDENEQGPDTIMIGVTKFTVEYMNCNYDFLKKTFSQPLELLISCRVISSRNFAVAIVQPRYTHMRDDVYYNIRELDE